MIKKSFLANPGMFATASLLSLGSLLFSHISQGLTFVLPHNGNVIGQLQYTTIHSGETLSTLGRRYDMGGYEMKEANPQVDYSNPRPGTQVLIPSRFVLPDGPRKGIVINLAEMRLYHYLPDGIHVATYPVGVGQGGWNTPLGNTQIVRKREHPTWVVPDSILENHEAHGQPIPRVQGPGPTNPLGDYAMNLGFQNIVIHGSPFPKGVGVRSSHGCIRMLNEDVEQLFKQVKVGTPVAIVHQTSKVGRLDNKIFLEAHVPLASTGEYPRNDNIGELVQKIVPSGNQYRLEWQEVHKLRTRATGYPQPIGAILSQSVKIN